ncbi:MAG TPA: tetratricopeptide repeat protein [Gemmatimonadaceae bacterium]|nr:tetratricopeptide repeat protein [Gemmatimonadaceae bacterium]
MRALYATLWGAFAVASATAARAQDTARTSRPTRVSSTGEVAVSTYNALAGDTAITRLGQFLTQYPQSALRPRALFQLAELLVRRADERFAQGQRAAVSSDSAARPDYSEAIARYEEIATSYPAFERRDAVAYTLGTLYAQEQRYTDAARVFERIPDSSAFRGEALFRLGDAYFELAATERGDPRRAGFARAATAYEKAVASAPRDGDIYFLSLYKLGWSYYNQATQTAQAEYSKAVDVFGRLIDAYDKLTPERQARLGLRSESLEYMAVAFTQVGGAEAANRYFASRGGAGYRLPVMRRVALSLVEQGDFVRAIDAFRAVVEQAPTDSNALAAQREIIDIYQNRTLEPEKAQQARLDLASRFGPESPWAKANAANKALMDSSVAIRELALRQASQYALAQAQTGSDRQRYAAAASLYQQYLREFATSDSAQAANTYLAEALFNTGEFMKAGAEYSRTAYAYGRDSAGPTAEQAGRNAIVAFDSAVAKNPRDAAAQDSLFAAVDRFVARFPATDVARTALIQKGRRASEAERWDVMAETFRAYAQRYPTDAFTPNAQKLVGDALYRSGKYAEAQVQWDLAQNAARQGGRGALADSIVTVRTAAAASYADTLIRNGSYERAAEDVYLPLADKNPGSEKAADALRDAIETYMLADSAARGRSDAAASQKARERAMALTERLTREYPRYQYRAQYQALRARLLAESGKREESVAALQAVIADNPSWTGRADAMVQVASSLDSLGRKREAAATYEAFAASYPGDRRAADAQYNAAVTYIEVPDSAAAGRAYGSFATRYPNDPRAIRARSTRLVLLRATGDSLGAERELASLCTATPAGDLRAACASRLGEQELRAGVALFPQYQAVRLVIPSKAQLTAAGVQRASAQKQKLLRDMSAHFTKSIETGSPLHLAASTFYVGLAQWEYGNFVKNVQLPSSLTDAERASATAGSERQATQYYDAAKKTWQALLDKAEQQKIDNEWVTRAREAVAGNVPTTPPPLGGVP